jgi:signal transduction histidine kinase
MLSRLTENLLELVRSDARRLDLDMSEVELQPLVDSEIARLKLEAMARKVELKAEVPEGIAVIADAGRLSRVLANLLGNAIHYSKLGGGCVTVAAGNGRGEVWIEVRDEGIGLDEERKRQVFDRFWRGDKARSIRAGGAGLGLSICREIAHAHGGQITVNSVPGLGSCFRICLPARVEC